jgi:hypothetical protein
MFMLGGVGDKVTSSTLKSAYFVIDTLERFNKYSIFKINTSIVGDRLEH